MMDESLRNHKRSGPSQSKNAMRMRELRKDPAYRSHENERKRNRRKQKKAEEKKNDEETVLLRIPKQSILSDYVYEVEENTGIDTEYYAICLKYITEVITYEHIRISEVDEENIPHAVLYRTANGNIRSA